MSREQDFQQIASAERERTFVEELWFLICEHKKYWLIPIVVAMLAFGLLVALSGTAVAPFVYTLF